MRFELELLIIGGQKRVCVTVRLQVRIRIQQQPQSIAFPTCWDFNNLLRPIPSGLSKTRLYNEACFGAHDSCKLMRSSWRRGNIGGDRRGRTKKERPCDWAGLDARSHPDIVKVCPRPACVRENECFTVFCCWCLSSLVSASLPPCLG